MLVGGALSQPADPCLEVDQRKSLCDVNVHFQAHKEKYANRLATIFIVGMFSLWKRRAERDSRKQRASVAS